MLELKNISKSFGNTLIFSKVSLQIEDGAFMCITGPSGSGKSTLLNIIGALDTATSGEILFNGKQVKQKDVFKKHVGFLFQNYALIENETIEQNLSIAFSKRDKVQMRTRIKEVLEIVGLNKLISTKVFTLSGGEQQRLAIARLIIYDNPIVLADEPTSSLDDANKKDVIDLLKQLNKLGKTVIVVSHDASVIENFNARYQIENCRVKRY